MKQRSEAVDYTGFVLYIIMAENKKSFLLYCDLIHTVSKMPKDKAGELFMHILQYVNDENPITEDLIIQLTFEPIKQSLKRDLEKYEKIRLKNIDNANKRWNKDNATASDRMPTDTKNAVSVNDTVSVNVKDTITKVIEIPTWEDFLAYAKEKEPSIKVSALKNKYDAWVENGWKDGNDKKIQKWKVKLLNTLTFIEKTSTPKEEFKYSSNFQHPDKPIAL